ncbi:MAG: EI24 domain-containing protein [Rubellimicrobium sp.]|nr:EI24 domain-containing protein [Rubellimicrobium sp.]
MIFVDFARAVLQLLDPRFRRVFWVGIALTLALLVGAYALFLWALQTFDPGSYTLPVIGEVTWIGDLLGWASIALMIVLSMFLMIPVASAITSLFLDDVAQAVEDRHYPHLPPASPQPFSEAAIDTVNFLGVLIGANILALALYVWFTPAAPVIFYGLNGFLLGREYFMIAAMRREGRAGAKALRARHRGAVWAAGCLMAVPLSIPIVNLVVPVLGAATFTHLYHRLAAQGPA